METLRDAVMSWLTRCCDVAAKHPHASHDGRIPYFDRRYDALFALEGFEPLALQVSAVEVVRAMFGERAEGRLLLSLAFDVIPGVLADPGRDALPILSGAWGAFLAEMDAPEWQHIAIANLGGVTLGASGPPDVREIAPGVKICLRTEALVDSLEPGVAAALQDDWHVGLGSEFVVVSETAATTSLVIFSFQVLLRMSSRVMPNFVKLGVSKAEICILPTLGDLKAL